MQKKNLWQNLKRPIVVLAPMAGYTDSTFRLLCREFGADVVVTELISADAVAYTKIKNQKSKIKINEDLLTYNKVIAKKNNNTAELLSFYEAERPIIIQLFGKHPEKFAQAASWISENLKPDGIDINMGCPARKVVSSDHGAALLKNHELAVEIVKAVKRNSNIAISVKTRLGWENDDEILEFTPKLVKAGIDAIIIHGRTYKDGFSGKARWENIYKIKKMFGDKLVVIGNGDIGVADKSEIRISELETNSKFKIQNSKFNLDGVAIGRATFGKPWIFSQNTKYRIQNTEFLKNTILRHTELIYKSKGKRGILQFRKHLLIYLKGNLNAKKLRMRAVKIENIKDVKKIIKEI